MITDFWKANPIDRHGSFTKVFCHNLAQLKQLSINWAKEKNLSEDHTLEQIESELNTMLDDHNLGFTTAVDKSHLIELENQKARILKEREEYWHIRSRAIWLKAGDNNTIFLQKYAKGRKVTNTIWNFPLPDGGVADTFSKISHLGSTHFKHLFQNPLGSNLADIINVAGHFP